MNVTNEQAKILLGCGITDCISCVAEPLCPIDKSNFILEDIIKLFCDDLLEARSQRDEALRRNVELLQINANLRTENENLKEELEEVRT